ncbi:bifunctional proline dehydrogenase/L-glutamate gamma-semialdehyde dehydrogenase PutA [Acetobacter fallax]|uniref:Bifunctional protein PutA n=1 Tax=Acetobacter fallax TaxID=1737473 RepID=A0ABX0K8N8_9PROT|nr:bifunctional proline dehydrogenase/L-glutamate gamma-semialdehyde dehydrogenase PutA [Acetobacter fallax]NHO32596.1 bifunctional proline dehydrogenase/L-glutamate gamma-semialdehyde dehydrogenase PutA [Acetobacter fallax]NHO36206.1 bifunctional proline dehydrogenase/L-glutamate gamma-semialdehyde dehydrogenase PutA [Acetobacter fallax]
MPFRLVLRCAITDHTRCLEPPRVAALMKEATLSPEMAAQVKETARNLVQALRRAKPAGIVQRLVQEYDLSTKEGVALMCLAEALLRIPDTATRDALIRDKLSGRNWQGHLGVGSSLFVNAATWGLTISDKILTAPERRGLNGVLAQLLSRCGEPVIRGGIDLAIRMMGEQFVTGQTIEEALKNSRSFNAKGFRYSYDMLGEAATTAVDAKRYYQDYEQAIHAIGKASNGQGVYRGPGISVKLSALHPRYSRLQRDRVMAELLPAVISLAALAAHYDIGFNVDAEEADRLELSLDLLEAMVSSPHLTNWDGLGFVVQAYQKRAPFVLDLIIDLARRNDRRLMVRLVKGAYWDTEIKRAQMEGMSQFPVFTRKVHTDVSYIACARKLLAAPDAVFPQFATHNAQTLASICGIAGQDFSDTRYEFQCLHGMGESLYKEVVGPDKLNRPVRVYAPVGTHETLLAYLVRRLLENGANSSFVNQIQDHGVTIDDLIADPAQAVSSETSSVDITLPPDLFQPQRANSAGLDLTDENVLRELGVTLPTLPVDPDSGGETIRNPADLRDIVGHVALASSNQADAAIAAAVSAFPSWCVTLPAKRAEILFRASDLLEAETPRLISLIVREAGKSLANAVGEIREAVDFLRYYGAQVRDDFDNTIHKPLGPVVCISPWNFPLAIFVGQISAALAAGNTVLAKPAEETPLIAREAVKLLLAAGIPPAVIQFVPGSGETGASLVADTRIRGVVFTGSTDVARSIRGQLARRLNPDDAPVPLIAETGGQNALIVDSSALAEQVVADVLASAFDSAGQRCSALRLLCLQEECADHVLTMLKGAMSELRTGRPDGLNTDVGPLISAEAQAGILYYIEAMRHRGHRVHQAPVSDECGNGYFVPPTLIEIDNVFSLEREVFGPVLHVLRFERDAMLPVIDAVNATGYALTFGIHTRIDAMAAEATSRSHAGNVYVNRSLIGAVVGVQPFGGRGLSGTGPKAGGALYLRRLLRVAPPLKAELVGSVPVAARRFREWRYDRALGGLPHTVTPAGVSLRLPGPVGEENIYDILPRGTVLCAGPTMNDLPGQIDAALATGNYVAVPSVLLAQLGHLPPELVDIIMESRSGTVFDAVLIAGNAAERLVFLRQLAERPGQIIGLHTPSADGRYRLECLVLERVVSTNTTAAGGNVALMTL